MTARLAYSLADAAEATGLSTSHLDRAIKAGKLRTKVTKLDADEKVARGAKRVILASELEAYLDGLPDA